MRNPHRANPPRAYRSQVCPHCDGYAHAATGPTHQLVTLTCPACAGEGRVSR